MLPDTLEELLDMELKNGLFDNKDLNESKYNNSFKTYKLSDLKRLINEKFDRYYNEFRNNNNGHSD